MLFLGDIFVLRLEKANSIEELQKVYKRSGALVVAHYHGLTVSELTKLRRALRANGAGFKVIKNTLSKIAAKNIAQDNIGSLFSGPSAVAYSEDPLAAVKTVVEFAKSNERLKIIGGVLEHKLINATEVQQIAKLPSLPEIRSNIVGLLCASATDIVRIIQTPSTLVARVIALAPEK